ncbi:murein biosynthesis integral membrane protein MurJ [Sinomonas mesophila]|uniref:murein biosynthesis integral membrane protein MurJ n=1 Tax=Sinomonas mesophila TaxID=1531955 RepID=UPI00111595B1|nr:murein biosynthesis integral membrane protein MurJ [Sinomonas mesophila]
MASTPAPASEARSSAIMAAGTLISRALGFVRSWMLILALGLGSTVADTFVNANNLPNLIFLLVAGGVFNAVLVPQIIKASGAPDGGADYISRLLTLGVLVMLGLTAAVTLAAPLVMQLTTSGYSEQQLALATVFAFWCLPQIFFYGLYALLTQVLNAHGAFGPAMWAPIINNVVAIAGLGLFAWIFGTNAVNPHSLDSWNPMHTVLVAGFSTLGVVVQTALLLVPVRQLRLGLRPRFGWRGVGLGHAARLGAWTLATAAVGQLTFLYVMKVASLPGAERERLREAGDPLWQRIPGNTVLEIASQLYLLPHSIIALSLATVLFNRMTQASQAHDRAGVREALSHGLRTMAVATVFSALALFALAAPLGMFFSGGKASDGVMLAQTLSILALSTPFMSANFMMARVFYANEDARTPFRIQLWLAALNVAGAFGIQYLPPRYVIFAIAALYTVGNILSVVISSHYLRRLLGHLDGAHVARSYIRMGYAAAGSALVGAAAVALLGGYNPEGFIWTSSGAALVAVAVIGVPMLLVYIVLLRAFRVTEVRDLARPLLGRLGARGAAAPSPAHDAGAAATGKAAAPAAGAKEPVAPMTAPINTLSDDTGIIPRISGQFDPSMYRARPSNTRPERLPGRRTFQGPPGQNPHFPEG